MNSEMILKSGENQRKTEKKIRKRDDHMVYPKKIMNRKELIELGFTEAYLMRAVAEPGQRFATRQNPMHRCSPILFDTEEFEKWRMKDMEMQERARKQTVVA